MDKKGDWFLSEDESRNMSLTLKDDKEIYSWGVTF